MCRFVKNVSHFVMLGGESALFVSIIVLPIFKGMPYTDARFTSSPVTVRFRLAPVQKIDVGSIEKFRVDYTTRQEADIIWGDFIASHMIEIPAAQRDAGGWYQAIVPEGTYKIRVNAHHFRGKEAACMPELSDFIVGDRRIDVAALEDYYNEMWHFYGKCYVPRPLLKGRLTTFIVLVTAIFVLTMVCAILYSRRMNIRWRGEGKSA